MAAPSKDLTTKQPIENIRSTLLDLRNSLGVLPWPDGKEVKGNDDAERRVRAEISDMEVRRIAPGAHADGGSAERALLGWRRCGCGTT